MFYIFDKSIALIHLLRWRRSLSFLAGYLRRHFLRFFLRRHCCVRGEKTERLKTNAISLLQQKPGLGWHNKISLFDHWPVWKYKFFPGQRSSILPRPDIGPFSAQSYSFENWHRFPSKDSSVGVLHSSAVFWVSEFKDDVKGKGVVCVCVWWGGGGAEKPLN